MACTAVLRTESCQQTALFHNDLVSDIVILGSLILINKRFDWLTSSKAGTQGEERRDGMLCFKKTGSLFNAVNKIIL